MHLAYFDESGDDGFPQTSSDLFVLSAVYLHHSEWSQMHRQIAHFRKEIFRVHGLPVSLELHTRELLLNKSPYHDLQISPQTRLQIVRDFCTFTANLNIRTINVAIDKKAILGRTYPVLERAFTYAIQRLENDLRATDSRFLIITDEGRVGKMRSTARKVQRFNPIPSKFGLNSYQKEIEYLVEDPLPKNSKESHFIQIADMMACLVSLYLRVELKHGPLPSRLAPILTTDDLTAMLETLKPSLNLKASPKHPLGIVCYPR